MPGRFASPALLLLGLLTFVMPAPSPMASAAVAVCLLLVATLLHGLTRPHLTTGRAPHRWRGLGTVGTVMPRQWAPAGPGRPQPRAPGGGCRVTITA